MRALFYRTVIPVICFILIIPASNAQPLDTLWTKTLGSQADEMGFDLQPTDDGGFIIAGTYKSTFDPRGQYVMLVKTDSLGSEIWRRIYGKGYYDHGRAVQQTTDGGYVVTGHMKPEKLGVVKSYLMKTDKDGNELWTKTYGGDAYSNARDVQKTMDGGYIIVGRILRPRDDIYVIKTDENGDELWSKTYGGQSNEDAYNIRQTFDGGYIILGTNSVSGTYLIKIDEDGNEIWSKAYCGRDNQSGADIMQTPDGGYIIAGRKWHGDCFGGIYILKIDQDSEEEWSRIFGEHQGKAARGVQQMEDGGYIFAGAANISWSGESGNIYLFRTDEKGDSLWSKTYDFGGGEGAHCIRPLPDGGYIVLAGKGTYEKRERNDDILLIRLGREGEANKQD